MLNFFRHYCRWLTMMIQAQGFSSTCYLKRVIACLQVALMFLTKGEMPHEALWEAWIREAEGLVPAVSLTDAECGALPHTLSCAHVKHEPRAGTAAHTHHLVHMYNTDHVLVPPPTHIILRTCTTLIMCWYRRPHTLSCAHAKEITCWYRCPHTLSCAHVQY
jgi:hypothetical protein